MSPERSDDCIRGDTPTWPTDVAPPSTTSGVLLYFCLAEAVMGGSNPRPFGRGWYNAMYAVETAKGIDAASSYERDEGI